MNLRIDRRRAAVCSNPGPSRLHAGKGDDWGSRIGLERPGQDLVEMRAVG